MTRLHLEVNFGQKNMQVILVFSNIEFPLLNILISVSKHWIFVRRITLCISYKVLLLKTDLHKFTNWIFYWVVENIPITAEFKTRILKHSL